MNEPGAIVAVCGGGTGGHIFPALAVAQNVLRLDPAALVYYFGREHEMEREIVSRHHLTFYGLQVQGFSRIPTWRNAVALWHAGSAFAQARRWLKQLGVQAILGTGGYVCGPVISAAASLGLPSIIHESNLIPGLTNRLLGRFASRIAVCHPQTLEYFPDNKARVMGFPLREGLNQPAREAGCQAFGLDPSRKVLLVFPGSLAAHKVNRAVAGMLPFLEESEPSLQVLWMTGHADLKMAQETTERTDLRVVVQEFIHAVPEAYAAADLVIARAGAGTIAELSATGKPALLVPYPFATDDHQTHNAAVLHKYGCAAVMLDQEISGVSLLTRVEEALKNLEYMRDCGAVLRADYPKTAAQDLAKMLIEMAQARMKK